MAVCVACMCVRGGRGGERTGLALLRCWGGRACRHHCPHIPNHHLNFYTAYSLQACPHMTRLGPCPGDPNAECFLWLAGSWLPPGAEVCNWYHHVAGDAAALQYGYLAQVR